MVDSIDPLGLVAQSRAVCEAATPGNFYADEQYQDEDQWSVVLGECVGADVLAEKMSEGDAKLLATARTLMPKLADELEDIYKSDMELRVRIVGKIGEIDTLTRERDNALAEVKSLKLQVGNYEKAVELFGGSR